MRHLMMPHGPCSSGRLLPRSRLHAVKVSGWGRDMGERVPGVRQSDEWLRAAEARLGIGFWSWEIETARLHCSAGLYALAGVNPAGLHLDLAFLESLVHPKDRLPAADPQSFAIDSRQSDRQFRIIRPDGQLRHLRSEARNIFDRDGNVTRVVAVVSDITENQDLRRRLANKRALLHAVSRLTDSVLWIADEEGRLVDHFGAGLIEAAPGSGDAVTTWQTSLHPDDRARLPVLWRETVKRRRPYRFSPRLRMADGQYRQVHIEGLPFSAEISPDPHYGGISSRNPRLTSAGGGGESDAPLSPAQVRACRALLDWTAEALAQNAGISLSTVRRIEGADSSYGQGDSLRLVVRAFREAGLTIWRGEDGRFCVSDLA